jgi:tetratricopeptide (TPR) repeat protein
MNVEENPILRLVTEVIEGRLSDEKAVEIAGSQDFLDDLTPERIVEALDNITAFREIGPGPGYLVSHVALVCSRGLGVGNVTLANSYVENGFSYAIMEDTERALEYYAYAIAIFDRLEQTADVARIGTRIADLYHASGNHREAITRYTYARDAFERIEATIEAAKCDYNMGAATSCQELGGTLEFQVPYTRGD